MNTNAIEIRGLQKSFGHFQLGPLDLTVPQGAIYGLVGPNGAGKTTTIDLILGMGEEDAGTIKVLGLDHDRDEVAVKSQVGYASPDLRHDAWGTVRKVLRFVHGFYPRPGARHLCRFISPKFARPPDNPNPPFSP